jgi:hypothetical protein
MAGHVVIQFSTTASKPFFWTGWKNRASFAIRWMGHSPFSHQDIVLEDGNMLGASDQGPKSPCIEGNPCGVAIRPPDYQQFGLRRRMIIKTPLADLIIARVKTQLGKPFDKGGLHNFLSSAKPGPDTRNWRDLNSWWCSEIDLWAFEWEGYWVPVLDGRDGKLPWPKTRVSPTDFLMIFLLDPNWTNRDTFWDPVPGLTLDPGEE